jgi:hypothetical protein
MFEFLVGAILKETLLKVQTKACTALLTYINGFNSEGDEDESFGDAQEIMAKYSRVLL